ncbi:RidA family protein [Leisingera daeponensis]|uniref:RidA family protein n=1 Tax=Leisingera daeponensis TaxID=405746 RepID=UPI001C98123A|nr:RidA family protein [Leisingera daeponensis]MBY6059377.1 RidA family protein [Leisingera daeponensis]
MLERRHITSLDGARKAQIVANGDLIFLSGMQPDRLDAGIKDQMRSALANVDSVLEEMGEDQSSVFIIHIWLKDMRYFSAMNAVWNEWANADNPPARTCVSGELYRPDLLVELVVTACRTNGAAQ